MQSCKNKGYWKSGVVQKKVQSWKKVIEKVVWCRCKVTKKVQNCKKKKAKSAKKGYWKSGDVQVQGY